VDLDRPRPEIAAAARRCLPAGAAVEIDGRELLGPAAAGDDEDE
jgi:hypothetical protein